MAYIIDKLLKDKAIRVIKKYSDSFDENFWNSLLDADYYFYSKNFMTEFKSNSNFLNEYIQLLKDEIEGFKEYIDSIQPRTENDYLTAYIDFIQNLKEDDDNTKFILETFKILEKIL